MSTFHPALRCPSCGGLLDLPEGEISGRCRHCSNPVLLPDRVRRFVLPSTLDSTDALRAVRRVIESAGTRRGTAARSTVRRPLLFYVPFWSIRAQVSGITTGVEPKYIEEIIPTVIDESDRNGMQMGGRGTVMSRRTVRTRVSWKAVEKEIRSLPRINISAADLEPLGIPSLSDRAQLAIAGMEIQAGGLPGGIEPLDSARLPEGVLVDPVVSLSEALSQAGTCFERVAGGSSRLLEHVWSWHCVTGRRAMLLYYPIWIVDFEAFGCSYKAIVDGRTGSVIRGWFPGRVIDRRIIAAGFAAVWAAAIPCLLHLSAGAGAAPGGGGCALAAVTALAAALFATLRFLGLLENRDGREDVLVI